MIISDEHKRVILKATMKKKLLISGGAALAVIALGLVFFGVVRKEKKPESESLSQNSTQGQAETLLTWDDPIGFTFQYPPDLAVNNHEEDNQNYAHVELTHKDHPGNLIVWVKDTTSLDSTAWARTDPRFKGASVLDTTLGGLEAKKVLIKEPKSMLIVGTIYDDLLYTVETELGDESYWTKVHADAVNSFAFNHPESSSDGNSAGSDEEPVDEEVVIE